MKLSSEESCAVYIVQAAMCLSAELFYVNSTSLTPSELVLNLWPASFSESAL